MTNFPTRDPAVLGPMLHEIGEAVENHLGFWPKAFVMILPTAKSRKPFSPATILA